MQQVGVMAVVEGLSKFEGDMNKMDSFIRNLVAPTNILGSAFGALGNILQGVGSFVVNTLAHAFGELLADAVQWVTTQIKELISVTIAAGQEFQTLSLRLNTLNFNDLTEDEKKFTDAQEIATQKTKEQLTWLQRLAVQTPYDNTDISNVYTLARGYGFVDDQARGLTETIVDFTSGMGLGNTEIVRIVKNFGQMNQLGKVMQRDLNDLATGAFVPVNRVLDMMRVETGLTGKAFDDFRTSGKGVESFLRNFTALVESDFGGSAEKMARTFGAATDNAKDFIKSVVGLNIVKPILDIMGSRLADFMDELSSPSRWYVITANATRIGEAATNIVKDILGVAPGAEGMADMVVEAFDKIADWLETNGGKIGEFVRGVAEGFKNTLVPAIQQVWGFLFGSEGEPGAIQKFGAWLKDDFLPFIQREVIPGLSDLFDAMTGKTKEPETRDTNKKDKGKGDDPTALESIVAGVASLATALPAVLDLLGSIGGVIATMFGADEAATFSEFVTGTLIPALEWLKTVIDNNRETIAGFIKFLLLLEVIGFVVGLIFSLVAAVGVLVFGFQFLVAVIAAIGAPILLLIALIVLLVVAIWENWEYIVIAFEYLRASIAAWWEGLKISFMDGVNYLAAIFQKMWDDYVVWVNEGTAEIQVAIAQMVEDIKAEFLKLLALGEEKVQAFIKIFASKEWGQIGREIIIGIARGIRKATDQLVSAAVAAAMAAVQAVKDALGVSSPSKVFMELGEFTIQGMAIGIEKSAGLLRKTMAGTMANMMVPAMSVAPAMAGASINKSQNTTNNFNATFNSNTANESLVQDYGMLQSLVQG